MNIQMLDRDEELKLAQEWRDYKDEESLHKLIRAYTRLVVSMAFQFRRYDLPIADIIQEGNIGLIIAAEKYRPDEHDARFSTYARWWIKACQQTYILKNWSIVRMGLTKSNKQLFFNLERLKQHLLNINTETMNPDDRSFIAKTLNVSVFDVETMEKRLSQNDLSLDVPIFSLLQPSHETYVDSIPDNGPNPEEFSSLNESIQEKSKLIESALNALSERERYIVRNFYLSESPLSIRDISLEIGLSRERVRQVLSAALKKMHFFLVHDHHLSKEDIEN